MNCLRAVLTRNTRNGEFFTAKHRTSFLLCLISSCPVCRFIGIKCQQFSSSYACISKTKSVVRSRISSASLGYLRITLCTSSSETGWIGKFDGVGVSTLFAHVCHSISLLRSQTRWEIRCRLIRIAYILLAILTIGAKKRVKLKVLSRTYFPEQTSNIVRSELNSYRDSKKCLVLDLSLGGRLGTFYPAINVHFSRDSYRG